MGAFEILRGLEISCDEIKISRAKKIVASRDVEIIDAGYLDDELVGAMAEVTSERNSEVYDVSVTVDEKTGVIQSTHCECFDYYNNQGYYNNYICKHCAATIIELAKLVKYHEETKKIDIEKRLLNVIENTNKPTSKLNLEVYINFYNRYTFEMSLKLGLDKLYVVKNIPDLIKAKNNYSLLYFGKNFTYNPLEQDFSEKDEQILDLITASLSSINNGYYGSNIKGKNIYISSNSLRSILKLLDYKGVPK